MAKVLITGVRGFTGRFLSDFLVAAGHEVCGFGHRQDADSPTTRIVDLLDRSQVEQALGEIRPDVVVHLAAIAFVAHGDARAIYDTNVVGTRNLLEAICSSGCNPRSVLLASSANVYGNSDREVLDEETPVSPANDYAVSKVAMEFMARLWMDKLPITIVRPFNYTGVGQSTSFLLPKIVEHFRDRRPVIELGNVDVIRDFSDVRSVVAAYVRLIDGSFAGQTFNVCSGHGYALRKVLAMAEQITGHHLEIRVNPQFVRANEVHKLIGSNEKLCLATGWEPDSDLDKTLEWMLAGTTVRQ
ncbi:MULTISPECIES: GDP-mannose 4,6-dehydratase [Burkholderia]|uniref:GDP-mannose 4,6-dehydratase n=1 Tax=Burkholderia TaxID=32008 RepID=UPI000398AB6D|nr:MULTISPECIES: GDP-mannose 4,6-dehydratase [Burkholderia]ERJ35187.1 UDP-glucose 4-epimerase [Burkholderia sp. AU4i]MCW3691389.1 GDP-mannose 4,6-dehydratase [Burkholderia cenocepacia]